MYILLARPLDTCLFFWRCHINLYAVIVAYKYAAKPFLYVIGNDAYLWAQSQNEVSTIIYFTTTNHLDHISSLFHHLNQTYTSENYFFFFFPTHFHPLTILYLTLFHLQPNKV